RARACYNPPADPSTFTETQKMPIRTLLLASLTFLACSAHAQANLGELLDFGGQKLTADEIRALGDVRVIARTDDADAFMALRSDGTAVGMVHNKEGHGS